jgi:hypothetical protein
VLVDDGGDLGRPPVGGDVQSEIDAPHFIGCIRADLGCGGSAAAFATATLRRPQTSFASEPLKPHVIDPPNRVIHERPVLDVGG